jgi:pyruvate formate lyase activating enzyme
VLRVGGLTRLSANDYPGKLAAVVFCQGCAWRCGYCHNAHLLPARGKEEVKRMGYLIGLHTAGIVPRRLAEVLPLLDWVGMDLKAPFEEHERVTGVRGSGRRAHASRELILASGIACEFHTVAAKPGQARAQAHHFADDQRRGRTDAFG